MAELAPDGRPAPGPSSAGPLDTGFFAIAVGALPTDAPIALPPDLHGRRRPVRHPRRLRLAGTRPGNPGDRPATTTTGGGDHPQPHRDLGGGLADARCRRGPHPIAGSERRCAGGDVDRLRAGAWRATRRSRRVSMSPGSSPSDSGKRTRDSSSGDGPMRLATASPRRSVACRRSPSRSRSAVSESAGPARRTPRRPPGASACGR